jgi:FkbM family methyltransferase
MNNFIKKFFESDGKRYLFGCTEEALSIIDALDKKNITITAVIDNFYPHDMFGGVTRIALDKVPADALIVSAVTNSRPIEVNEMLIKGGYLFCDYFQFYRESGVKCKDIPFWNSPNQHFTKHKEKYQVVRNLLVDQLSKDTFDAIVNFRNSYDLSAMAGFKFNLDNMYFERFLPTFPQQSNFFDLGAFDGCNSLNFLSLYPKGRCYLFEPIPEAEELLTRKFSADKRLSVISSAVGSTNGFVAFSLDGTSSKVSAQSNNTVEVAITTLDTFVKENSVIPHYIKMDVEGFEEDVIHGSSQIIQQHKPTLAISVYHKVEHLIDLPLQVLKLSQDYSFYLRHYTQGYTETVLFAVPNNDYICA